MTAQSDTLNSLGLAALHLATNTGHNLPELLEQAGPVSPRVGRWLTVVALMRCYELHTEEVADILQLPVKSVHRMLHSLQRFQRSDPRVAAAVRRLREVPEWTPQAA